MSTCEYILNNSHWDPRPLPAHDDVLLRLLGITYYDLVFTDYKLVWDIIAKHKLSAKEVQRIKHIRKREKNKLFARGQVHTLEEEILNLTIQKEELINTRERIGQECLYWEDQCQQQQFNFQFAISDQFQFTAINTYIQ